MHEHTTIPFPHQQPSAGLNAMDPLLSGSDGRDVGQNLPATLSTCEGLGCLGRKPEQRRRPRCSGHDETTPSAGLLAQVP
jgi:hypothetical protein